MTFHEFRLFERIHNSAKLSRLVFKDSLNPKLNEDKIFKAGEGTGRSGSFFFHSQDNRFIVKTMSSQELDLFVAIL